MNSAASSDSRRIGVLYASGAELAPSALNMNWGQRVTLAPSRFDLRVLVRREAAVDVQLPSNVEVRRAGFGGRVGLYLAAIRRMARARHDGIEVVVTDRSAVALAAWACRSLGRYRWIVDIWDVPHAEMVTYYARPNSLTARWRRLASKLKLAGFRRLLRRSDRVLASIQPEALAVYRLPRSKVAAFSNAIRLDRLTPLAPDEAREPASICFVTKRFLDDRGVDVLVNAITRFSPDQAKRARVRLAGDVSPEIEALVRGSVASASIEMLGDVSIQAAHELMRRSQIGVVPHHLNEDHAYRYPVKLLEYMAIGCVVVASDLPGIRTVIEHEREGLLVRPGDSAALAQALGRVLDDRSLREDLRAAAYERVHAFDAKEKAEAIYAVIEEAARA